VVNASAAASVEASPSVAATPGRTGPLKFANRLAYIDLAGSG
jgi:hypothetical protein